MFWGKRTFRAAEGSMQGKDPAELTVCVLQKEEQCGWNPENVGPWGQEAQVGHIPFDMIWHSLERSCWFTGLMKLWWFQNCWNYSGGCCNNPGERWWWFRPWPEHSWGHERKYTLKYWISLVSRPMPVELMSEVLRQSGLTLMFNNTAVSIF